jgi:8-oxo-dGTP pyrophosphatase MutT (NUDIX family)
LARDPRRPAAPSGRWATATGGLLQLVRLRCRRLDPSDQRRRGAVARLRVGTATSAGGIVVRFDDGIPSLVVGARRRDRDILTWTLPKGTPNPGESREQTAVREVREETGLEVRITDILESIEYWFVQRGTRIHKTVHYFLMEPLGGDLSRHDHEFDQVRWIRFDQAAEFLTFETERSLVVRAAEVVDPAGAAARSAAAGRGRPSSAGAPTPGAHPPIGGG